MNHDEYSSLLNKNESEAQRMLFNEYLNYVYTIVRSRLMDIAEREDIEECISDIFAEIFSSYKDEAENHGDMKGFIGVVAYRKSLRYLRRLHSANSSKTEISEEYINNIPSEENIAEQAELHEAQRILTEAVKSLGEPDSAIIFQKYYFGRKSGEIAKLLSMSPTAVRVRMSRAIKKLKKILSESEEGSRYFNEK